MSDARVAWLLRRHSLLTASDAAAVFGLNGSRSRSDVLRDKRRPSPGENDEVGRLNQVRAGKCFEAAIIDWFTLDHPLDVVVRSPSDALYITPQYDRLAATPDATVDGRPLEIKNVGEHQAFNWSETGVSYELNGHNGKKPKCVWPSDECGSVPEPVAIEAFYAPEYTDRPRDSADDELTEWRAARDRCKQLRFGFGKQRAPLKYWVQLQIQMMALSQDSGVISAAVGGTSRIDLTYLAHVGFQQWAVEQAKKFWRDV